MDYILNYIVFRTYITKTLLMKNDGVHGFATILNSVFKRYFAADHNKISLGVMLKGRVQLCVSKTGV